jgi:hypothetical protein
MLYDPQSYGSRQLVLGWLNNNSKSCSIARRWCSFHTGYRLIGGPRTFPILDGDTVFFAHLVHQTAFEWRIF